MPYTIQVFENRKNPSIFVINTKGEIVLGLEERKVNKKTRYYPRVALIIAKSLYPENNVVKIDKIPDIKNEYIGLSYSTESIIGTIRVSGVYYWQHVNEFSTPNKFFSDVASLVNSGLKVGWFQLKNAYGDGIDLNRCIIQKVKHPYSVYSFGENIIKRVIHLLNCPYKITNLKSYSPDEAIKLIKDKKIDVLVIHNLIVFRHEQYANEFIKKQQSEVKDETVE